MPVFTSQVVPPVAMHVWCCTLASAGLAVDSFHATLGVLCGLGSAAGIGLSDFFVVTSLNRVPTAVRLLLVSSLCSLVCAVVIFCGALGVAWGAVLWDGGTNLSMRVLLLPGAARTEWVRGMAGPLLLTVGVGALLAVANLAFYRACAVGSLATASALSNCAPGLTIALSLLVTHEPISTALLVSGVMVVGAACALAMPPRPSVASRRKFTAAPLPVAVHIVAETPPLRLHGYTRSQHWRYMVRGAPLAAFSACGFGVTTFALAGTAPLLGSTLAVVALRFGCSVTLGAVWCVVAASGHAGTNDGVDLVPHCAQVHSARSWPVGRILRAPIADARHLRREIRAVWPFIAAIGVCDSVSSLCYSAGVQFAPTAMVATAAASAAGFGVLIAVLARAERVDRYQVWCLVAIIGGLCLLQFWTSGRYVP